MRIEGAMEPQSRDVAIHCSRRFLFWPVSRAHYLIQKAVLTFDLTEDGANISAKETGPVVEVLHPWWERAAYWLARPIP